MRPSLPVLVRVLTRSELKLETQAAIVPRPLKGPIRSDKKRPTLIQTLKAEKEKNGKRYPSNVRIEPVLQRHLLAKVEPEARKQLLSMLREH